MDEVGINLAVKEGFEPSIRYKRIHTFQACSFNHSDTSPDRSGENASHPDALALSLLPFIAARAAYPRAARTAAMPPLRT